MLWLRIQKSGLADRHGFMKKISSVIVSAIIALVIVYKVICGAFDGAFWIAFVPGLLTNLIVLLVGVLIVDRILQKDRWARLEQVNASQSKFVFFIANRMAYWLLEYLGLARKAEIDMTGD